MATYTLGQAAIVNMGAWASGATYVPLNFVASGGGSFLCKANATNIQPGVTSGWANYWVSCGVGIKSIAITSPATGTATVAVTLSDGSATSFSFTTTAIAEGSVGTAELADGAVTPAKSTGLQPENIQATATLTVAGWSSKTQTVNVTGVTANNAVILSPAAASWVQASDNGVRCSGQGAGTLTFTCEDVPTAAMTYNVIIFN